MVRTYKAIVLLWCCLLAVAAVQAQGVYHYATVYYINLQDEKGKSVNNDYDANCISAYVGDVPRATSNRWTVDAKTGKTVFAVRVGGKEGDADKVTFHVKLGNLEYVLGELPFHGGRDEQYNMPSQPVDMAFIPIHGVVTRPSVISVKKGEKVAVTPQLQPENHNALYTEEDIRFPVFEYRSSNSNVFTVSADGVIKGVETGEARLDVVYNYKVRGDVDSYYTYPVASTFASVSVVTDDIPVTGIRNDMGSLQIEREVNQEFRLSFTVLPEVATNRRVRYAVGDESILSCTVNDRNEATFRGVAPGRTTITVTSEDNLEATLTYHVTIIWTNVEGDVTGIAALYDKVDVLVGDEVTSQLGYTVYPDYAADKRVAYTVFNDYGTTALKSFSSGKIEAVAPGQARVEISSVENPVVKCSVMVTVVEKREANRFTLPDEITLSKFSETMLTLNMEPAGATCDPAKLVFSFASSANAGWGSVATAVPAGGTGRNWLLQGRYAGDYTCTATYDGKAVQTKSGRSQMQVHIPADYVLHDGWHWLSLYAVPSNGSLALKANGEWAATLGAGDFSRVYEIRTQEDFVHYDFALGYFGTLTELRPSDGCFKVNVECEDMDDGKLLLTAGSQNLKHSTGLSLPQARTGYTWMTYPHELSHTLKTMDDYLKKSASEGDRILSSDDFIEFTNGQWTGTADFVFEAGRGYIYYTEDSGSKTIDWGPADLAPENVAARPLSHVVRKAAGGPDNMAMVVKASGGGDYTVAAYVDGQCRGVARTATDGLLHLSVGGQAGEEVSLCLMNKFTGEVVPTGRIIAFGTRAGNHRQPVELGLDGVAAASQGNGQATIYDLQGRCVDRPQATGHNSQLQRGVYIMNGKKYIK